MVSGYDNPVFFCIGKHRFQPGLLLVDILFAGIGIFITFLAVFLNQRSRVNPDDADGGTFLFECLGVITGGHCPAAADMGVIQYGLRVSAIFMVSQDREPVDH